MIAGDWLTAAFQEIAGLQVEQEPLVGYSEALYNIVAELPGSEPDLAPVVLAAHYDSTAPEIWEGMDGRIDAFVYGSGTGGTISGVGRFLKERLPDVPIVVVEPERSAVLSGEERGQHKFQGMGPGFIPANLDLSLIDRIIKAREEDAFPLARRPAREEGLFVGMSSGAIVWAAMKVAREIGPGHRAVWIAPDSASRYLTTELFKQDEPLQDDG